MECVFSNNVCRLCLWKSSTLLSIFSEAGELQGISWKMRTCLPISVAKEDTLPKMICPHCVYKLEMFYEFHTSCVRTDTTLKNYMVQPAAVATTTNRIVSLDEAVEPAEDIIKVEALDLDPIGLEETDIQPSTSTAAVLELHTPQAVSVHPDTKLNIPESQSSATRYRGYSTEINSENTGLEDESSFGSRLKVKDARSVGTSAKKMGHLATSSTAVSSSSTGMTLYTCKPCGRVFKSSYLQSKHCNSKSCPFSFCCQYCDKTFTGARFLALHEKTHIDQKPMSCQVCQKTFKSEHTLKYHVENKCVTAAISNDHQYASNDLNFQDYLNTDFLTGDTDHIYAKTENDLEVVDEKEQLLPRCEFCGLQCKNRAGLASHKRGSHSEQLKILKNTNGKVIIKQKTKPFKTNSLPDSSLLVHPKKKNMKILPKVKGIKIKNEKPNGIRGKAIFKSKQKFNHRYAAWQSGKRKHIDTPCTVCGKVFISVVGMYIHRATIHKDLKRT